MASIGSVVYAPLITQLSKLGFQDIQPIDLPSIDCLNHLDALTPNPLEADIRYIRQTLTKLVDVEKKSVLVIAHSYGGTPALAAAEGLWKAGEKAESGGVLKAILLSSSLTLPGASVAGDRTGWSDQHGVELDTNVRIEVVEGMPVFYPDGMEKEWFNDLPVEEARRWADTLRPSAIGNVISPAPDSTVGDWKIAYLVTSHVDLAMPGAFQVSLVEKARGKGAEVDVKVMTSGHFVQITHAVEVAEWVRELSV